MQQELTFIIENENENEGFWKNPWGKSQKG